VQRGELLDRLRGGGRWDIVVIGGGATGLGTAVEAAARGLRTALLEAHDFAKGTSSRSTKLIHGGVRYLARGQVGLVREALHERTVLRRNAPHLVHDLAFVVPSYSWWGVPYYGVGLKLYDWLARAHGADRSRAVSADEALELAPTLTSTGLRGAIVYEDAQFDDARLAISLLRTFLDLGGTALNYAPVTGFRKSSERIDAVEARDAETGETWTLEARAVVNATGVFADEVRRLDQAHARRLIRPSQGAHLVLDRAFLPGSCAVLIPRTDDGRVLFAIPWHGRTLLGTTDTPVERLDLEPKPLPEEVAFLLAHAGRYLSRAPREDEVRSAFAGLRPLVDRFGGTRTASLSREHVVQVSESGLVTIAGGKWTTYRRMGTSAVDAATAIGGLPRRPCATESLTLHGGLGQKRAASPFEVYGSDAGALSTLLGKRPDWNALLHPALPYRAGEVVWAARYELARTVEDVLARRTRALILDARASREAAPRVAALLAGELGFDVDWQVDQVRRYEELAEGYCLS
jgi:glycerol-3-phosphate dehydrogenase